VADDYDLEPVEGNPFAPYINPETGRPRITIAPPREPPIDPVIMPGDRAPRQTLAEPLPPLPDTPGKVPQQPEESWMQQFRREGYGTGEPTGVVPDFPRNMLFGSGQEVARPLAEQPDVSNIVGAGYAAAGFLPIPGAQGEDVARLAPDVVGSLSKVASGVISADDEAAAIAAQARRTAVQNAVGRAKTASRGDQAPSPAGYYRGDTQASGGATASGKTPSRPSLRTSKTLMQPR